MDCKLILFNDIVSLLDLIIGSGEENVREVRERRNQD